MATILYNPKIGLYRIVDGRSKKILKTSDNKAVDKGGQRSELDAMRLLKAYRKGKKP